ncbi:putative phosphatase regulatory subunit-domain-containing protein [Crucibulum laeve]|uniref:Putative phosphatase regulatory subunit-domain-containing protein n=1 Tax=Crucibulum laeve TaxID=68775 RepID=A0A5C3LPR6_9AGAR|nr:putative phosphatase regulatory subunit-domain-containing protein [Crucibulum laeve]
MATMTVQARSVFQTQDNRISLNANAAGAPLPLIPRRAPAVSRSYSAPTASSRPYVSLSSTSTSTVTLSATPLQDDSDSSSSSGSSVSDGSRPTIRTRKSRDDTVSALSPPQSSILLPPVVPKDATNAPAFSAPLSRAAKSDENTPPARRHLIYTPGVSLRLNLDAAKSRYTPSQLPAYAESSAQGSKASTRDAALIPAPLIRKKSGQLVKPSLKTSNSTRGSLSIVTMGGASKSEPATPTHSKAVHFDTQLEHVKLFLAEQKPLAVSRDGSPTDDTSGTESDFPSFIYGDDDKRKGKLAMRVTNIPSKVDVNTDVGLEDLSLSPDGTNILGRVRVRNLAYNKWVAIRFTFDSWQTTSEVTGKYSDSINEGFDRFTFAIKLNDLLARIDEKTLMLAVRYSIEGQEMWDNNNGQNYVANFSRVLPTRRRSTLSDDEASSASDVADLCNKLEKVATKERTGPAFAQTTPRRNPSPEKKDPAFFRSNVSLASRYDFGASLKSPWKPSDAKPRHTRVQSYPVLDSPPSTIPFPQKKALLTTRVQVKSVPLLGSPRDLDPESFLPPPRSASELDDAPFPIPVRDRSMRNHQRGYFDLNILGSTSLRRTPPGTPSVRSHSFPPIEPARSPQPEPRFMDYSEDSAISTPSLATPTSSAGSSPTAGFLTGIMTSEAVSPPLSPSAHYRQFLNKFCFFTGSELGVPDLEFDLPRTHSASDVEEFLAGTPNELAEDSVPATRSSSLDDIVALASGGSTPTNIKPFPLVTGYPFPPTTSA